MSSKKSKKQKWKPIETEVISIASGTCWADEVEKEQTSFSGFGGFGYEAKPLNLPKAPRAACESIIDEASIPQEGPFLVHMSNLQFEIDEDDITTYFKGLKIENIKLPRNDNGRNKGFGYVEFEDRKDLIVALGMENLIRGRRVRVELASSMNDSRNAFQRSSRMGMDFGSSSDEPGDWRSSIRTTTTDDRGGFPRRREGGAFDKDHDSERDNGPWRSKRNFDDDISRKPFTDRRFDDSDGKRRPFSDVGRPFSDVGRPFSDVGRPFSDVGRPFSDRRSDDNEGSRRQFGDRRNDDFDSSRKPFGDRHNDIDGRKPFGESRRGFGFRRDDDLPELAGENTSVPSERPKLILKPKTVGSDAAQTEAPNNVPAQSIFGGAKPVDTAAKEREIEEKLLAKQEPKPQLSAASSVTSLNEISDTKSQEESEVRPPPVQSKTVETWRRRSPRRQNDDDRQPRKRVSPERHPRYEQAPPPRENAWEKKILLKEQPSVPSDENVCNGTPPIEETDKPRPNVYIPPNLRKKETALEEQEIASDRAADGSEIIDAVVVESPIDVRTDPDGQSSEPEIVKDQPTTDKQQPAIKGQSTVEIQPTPEVQSTTEVQPTTKIQSTTEVQPATEAQPAAEENPAIDEDKNDSGFIECDKAKKKPKVAKKIEIDIKKKDPVLIKEQKKSTSNKFAALLDDGSNE